MAAPNPRSKLLPARGNKADLEFLVEDILEGEMCYAYDEDRYYQKEGGLLVAVGASKEQGIKADTALQDAPDDSKQYGRSGGTWVEIDTTDTGAVGVGNEGEFPYYAADGRILSSAGSGITMDLVNNKLVVDSIEVGTFQLNETFNVDSLTVNGTGPAIIDSGSDIQLQAVGDISAENSVIKNLATPTEGHHAATRSYVDQEVLAYAGQFPRNIYQFDGSINSTAWVVNGPGLAPNTTDPTLYLWRGLVYNFDNTASGNNDPLLIKTSVTSGTNNQFDTSGDFVTGDPNGIVIFEVAHNTSYSELYIVSQATSQKVATLKILGDS